MHRLNEPETQVLPPAAQDALLTRAAVARILGVSPTTVTRWAREGRLRCQLTLGGHHRYSSRLIEEVRDRLSRGLPFAAGTRTPE
jgi:AraC-like DNA-binding protein